jgi:transcriptional regulator of acetoin/glycerol metabolism
MLNYNWPGNVRELSHVIERACILCQDGVLQVQHLPLELQGLSTKGMQSSPPVTFTTEKSNQSKLSPTTFQYQSEEDKIVYALRQANYNKRNAAKLLGVARSTLYRRIQRYHILEE